MTSRSLVFLAAAILLSAGIGGTAAAQSMVAISNKQYVLPV